MDYFLRIFDNDALSRLVQGDVVADGSTYTQRLEYDDFGNILWNETTTSGRRDTPTQPWSNHLTGATYNQAGSVVTWNGWSHEWDPMQMMTRRVTGTTQNWHYVYTADDERYWSHQHLEGSDSRLVDTFVLRDLDGRPLREYRFTFSTWMDYIYRGKTLLARDSAHARPEAIHVDHLGTSRFGSGPRRERLVQPNYYPFGEELTTDTQQPYDRLKFTGHERDSLGTRPVADDLDYMHARFRSPLTSRFLSTDPVLGTPKLPQSWNRYAYVLGNPIRFVDPDGRATEFYESIAGGLEAVGASISATGDSFNDGTWGGVVSDTLLGTTGEFIGGIGDMFRTGDAIGGALGSGADSYDMALAVSKDVSRSAQLFLTFGSTAAAGAGIGPKVGSSGGVGSGARFGNKTKAAARAESGNTCVFCGSRTTAARGPRQSQIDHARSRSTGGNNSLANAQNTCRTCNLEKGAKGSVRYFIKRLFRWAS